MFRHVFIISLLLFSMSWQCWAVPARKGLRTVQQPDGTTLKVELHGDEYFHYFTNEQGEWMEQNEKGEYVVVPALSDAQVAARRAAGPLHAPEATQTPTPLNIVPRGLIILAQYKDVPLSVHRDTIDSMMMGENFTRHYQYTYGKQTYTVTASGSARQYFQNCSYGQYNPQFDVVGPVSLSKNQADYAGPNAGTKNQNMIREACQLADSKFGVDFSQYDCDNDGFVDFVYVLYSGLGKNDGGDSKTIWPHASNLSQPIQLDGKTVKRYVCGAEINGISKTYYGIGLFCHEFGHILGLPDFYQTGSNYTFKTLGTWDVMDYGNYNNDANTPPAYSGYERFFMGWATPRVLTDPEDVTLNDLSKTNEVLLITSSRTHNLKGNDPDPNTFYVLENRQKEGWFEYCQGHGLLLTKVQYDYGTWKGNYVNNDSNNQKVDLIEADGKAPYYDAAGWFGKEGDTFPSGATEYKGIKDNYLTAIEEENGVITFKFRGGSITTAEETEFDQEEENKKVFYRGQLVIRHNQQLYNAMGQRIQ